MSNDNLTNNPFAALFGSIQQAQEFSTTFKHTETEEASKAVENTKDGKEASATSVIKINALLEHVFLITLDEDAFTDRPSRCVFLKEVKESLGYQEWLDLQCIEQAVFERLVLDEPAESVVVTCGTLLDPQAASAAGEKDPLRYLYQCYCRLQQQHEQHQNHKGVFAKCQAVILMNAKTCFQTPAFFPELDPVKQFIDIFLDNIISTDADQVVDFFELVSVEIDSNSEDGSIQDVFTPILDHLKTKIQKEFSLGHGIVYSYLDMLYFFSKRPCLAETLVRFNQPRDSSNGRAYENTLFGAVLSLSCIVTNEQGPYDFFDNPSRYTKKDHDITENSIHQPIGMLNDRMHQLFLNILKSGPEPKSLLLDWVGNCMMANKGRAKLWSRQMMPMMYNQIYCSDGFFLNLCAVLLRLCQPFSAPCDPKLLKVQPTYCLATVGEREQVKNRNVHLRDINDTGLIPPTEGCENEQPQLESSYNFVSECFFLAHYGLHLGFHSAHERFMKLNQNLHRIQGAYNDIVAQGAQNSETGVRIKEQMEKGMTIFLCLKAAMCEPRLLELSFDLHVATTTYLVHLATSCDHTKFQPVTFPLPESVPQVLTCVPEFVAENALDFMLFIRRFKDALYESVSSDKLEHLMTFILVFMGSPNYMRNPHLRARMAEALEAIMPPSQSQGRPAGLANFQREQLFHNHPLSQYLAPTLVHVFVSIEMTGQGVEFEQKFNYRRPMYTILEYLWGVTRHRNTIKEMAVYAEEHIAAVDAPLFLRFINLLINDAIFLLDEALSYMVQIKEKQMEQESGAWNSLSPQQRQETETDFRHLSMLGRFHNIMGNDTIKMLEMMTTEVKSIFYDDVLVDRIAAMLNYFLQHLVGPKQKNLRVKDFDQFEFKPHRTVSHISQIYINLGEGEKFRRAVAGDGRSYSEALFVKAKDVLVKIHRPMESIIRFDELAEQFKELATQQAEDDKVVNDAPEEFLDPIMGTYMRDPVLLPSSGQIVDRSTIARHILSDQFDPFNRQPLTMDQVTPVADLQTRSKEFLAQWRLQRRQKAQAKREELAANVSKDGDEMSR